jgi:hypothetical protein
MKRIITACLALLVVLHAKADDAKTIIEKAIKAHGGKDILDKYPASASKFKGEMSISGVDVTFEGKSMNGPNQFKMEMQADFMGSKMIVLQIVDGDKVKSKINLGGMDIPNPGNELEAEEMKFALVNQEIAQLTPLLAKTKKYALKAEAEEEVDGKKASVITVSYRVDEKSDKTKEVKVFFDKEKNLLVKFARKGLTPGSQDGKESLQETVFSEFKVVEGLTVAMKSINFSEGKKFMTMTQTDYKPLEKLEAKDIKIDD